MTDKVIVDRHWCLTEDRSRVVHETDPRARWLKWAPGTEVDREEFERLARPEPEAPVKRGPGRPRKQPEENKYRPAQGRK